MEYELQGGPGPHSGTVCQDKQGVQYCDMACGEAQHRDVATQSDEHSGLVTGKEFAVQG